jgi:hypothetical protein
VSGFSADWLALREPADQRARNPGIVHILARSFADAEAVSVCDLGCGTGSSLRALAPILPLRQRWQLIDSDGALLAAARTVLAAWADEADEDLRLRAGDREINVSLVEADLNDGLDSLLPADVQLVTSSALIDLVSEAWLDDLVAAARRRGSLLLMALAYAGIERWQPAHAVDAAMLDAFNAHQRRDKGFGPALGRTAAEVLSRKLKQAGYEVVLAPSPWQLTAGRDAALMSLLVEGIAAAVAETGEVASARIAAWLAARRKAAWAEIAHIDLFARLP